MAMLGHQDAKLRSAAVPLILGIVSVVFSGIYVLEWRISRKQTKDLVAATADAASTSVRNLGQLVLKNQAILQRLQAQLTALENPPSRGEAPIPGPVAVGEGEVDRP